MAAAVVAGAGLVVAAKTVVAERIEARLRNKIVFFIVNSYLVYWLKLIYGFVAYGCFRNAAKLEEN
jgi:hypothetical protein